MPNDDENNKPQQDEIVTKDRKFRRSFQNSSEVFQSAKRIVKDNEERTRKSAAITKLMNDSQIWSQEALVEAGQSWRRNACTGFFSSLVKRLTPGFSQIIQQAKFLTMSSLDGKDEMTSQKTADFREAVTKFLRKRTWFSDFNENLIQEVVVYGYAAVVALDEFSCEPMLARGDEVFFPEGCSKEEDKIPMFCYKQVFQIHDLAEILSNEFCGEAGWKVNNLIECINNAQPENRRNNGVDGARQQEDVVRETGFGAACSDGVKVVEAYHTFAKEPSGKVSHWIHDKTSGKLLFKRLDQFETMRDVIVVFTLEPGNGKIHSCKGVGRMVYNTAIGAEQSRNLICDNLYLSGMLLLKSTTKGKTAASITVQHPVCVIGADFEVQKTGFEVNVDAFFGLDRFFTNVAEVQVGAYLSQGDLNQKGEKATASQVHYIASIEQQLRQTSYTRFWLQYSKLIGFLQRRIFSPDHISIGSRLAMADFQNNGVPLMRQSHKDVLMRFDDSAQFIPAWDDSIVNADEVEMIAELIRKGVMEREIFAIGICPTNESIQDPTETNIQKVDMLMNRYRGHPSVKQEPLMRMDIAAIAGNDVAERLIIPETDNSIKQEATRLQVMELPTIMSGEDVPVSPRDAHMVHMGVILEKFGGMIEGLSDDMLNEEAMNMMAMIYAHHKAHLDSELAKGTKQNDPSMQPFVQFSGALENKMRRGAALMEKSAAAQLQGGGKPMMAPPPPDLSQMEMTEGMPAGSSLAGDAIGVNGGLPDGRPLSYGQMNLVPQPGL